MLVAIGTTNYELYLFLPIVKAKEQHQACFHLQSRQMVLVRQDFINLTRKETKTSKATTIVGKIDLQLLERTN